MGITYFSEVLRSRNDIQKSNAYKLKFHSIILHEFKLQKIEYYKYQKFRLFGFFFLLEPRIGILTKSFSAEAGTCF